MDVTADTPTGSLVLARCFADIDQLNEVARGWQVDFRQLDRGPLGCGLVQIADGGLLLSRATFDRHIEQRGAAPAGAVTFAVPGPGAPPGKMYPRR